MPTPLVSICIPTYRGGEFLAAAIESALAQSFGDLEVWVLDDNSPDNTTNVVAQFTDSRLHYLRNPANLGPQGNWNRCLEVAQGKYFKLLPHDDVLAPTAVADQVAILEADRDHEVALVFGQRKIIDPNGRVLMRRGLPGVPAGRIDGRELIRRCVRAGTNLIGEPGNGLVRRTTLANVGPYDAKFPYVVDLDYWFRTLLQGDGYYTKTESSSFRISPGSWSVAIGNNQHRDFSGLLDQVTVDARYHVSAMDRRVGMVKSRVNTVARAAVYRYLFPKRRK